MRYSNLSFKWYFTDDGQAKIKKRLLDQQEILLRNIKSKKSLGNLKKIEEYLTELFYPENDKDLKWYIQDYRQQLIQITSRTVEDTLRDFDINKYLNAAGQIKASSSITKKSLESEIKKAEMNLQIIAEAVKKSSDPTQLIQIEQQLQKIKNDAEQILHNYVEAKYFRGRGKNIYEYKNTQSSPNLASQSLELAKKLRAFDIAIRKGQNFSPTELGDLFEQTMAKASATYLDSTKREVTEEMIDYLVGGNKSISRGSDYGRDSINYRVSIENITNKKALKKINNNFSINQNNYTATYTYNPNENKMGKLDVLMQFPSDASRVDPTQKFRASLKNWTTARSIGETSIDAGLSRAINFTEMEYYRLAILDSKLDYFDKQKPKVQWQCGEIAHSLAKIGLASDIVMGLNQGDKQANRGLANVLIINDMLSQHVYVRDISTMIDSVDKIEKFLKGYSNTIVSENAKGVYNSIKQIKDNRTESYLGLMTSTLNKMKVSYELSNNLNNVFPHSN